MSAVTSPFIIAKTMQQVKPELSLKYVIKETYHHSNHKMGRLSNFFIGYPFHAMCEGPGRAIYMATYEGLKRSFCERRSVSSLDATLVERMASAAAAGVVCWTSIYPFDVVRNRIYSHHVMYPAEIDTPGVLQMTRIIYKERGFGGFVKGIGPTVLRAGPVAATVLPIYDTVLEYLISEEK